MTTKTKARPFLNTRTQKLRALLALRDGLKCHWCGRELVLEGYHWNGHNAENCATLDHYPVAKSQGGILSLENAVLACQACNCARSAKSQAHHCCL